MQLPTRALRLAAAAAFALGGGAGEIGAEVFDYVASYEDGMDGGPDLSGATAVAVSPDGHHVYVASFLDDSVSAFAIERDPRGLTFLESHDDAGSPAFLDGASGIAVSPDGSRVYVTAFEADTLNVFERDPATGALTVLDVAFQGFLDVTGLDGAFGVAVSPDGGHVYVAGHQDDLVAAFSVVPSGVLFQESVGAVDPFDEVMERPRDLVVSDDGAHVYLAAANGSLPVVFQRDPLTGALTFSNGVFGSASGISKVALSSDDRSLYATTLENDSVLVYLRNPSTGQRDFVAEYGDTSPGFDGLEGASDVTVTPDGRHVLVAGTGESAVAVLERDPALGRLALVQVLRDGVEGVESMCDPIGLDTSAGGDLVVASSDCPAVILFVPEPRAGAIAFVALLALGILPQRSSP